MNLKFSLFTIYTTILALLLGNLVVATNSGDACGSDWPICNGQIIPDFSNYQISIEYSHRLFTTLLGFVILINAIIAWKKATNIRIKLISILTLFLLLLQAVIGGLNVRLGTPVGFTTLDVTFSLFLLISLIFLHVGLNIPFQQRISSGIKKPMFWGFTLLVIEIIIGAIFKHFDLSEELFINNSKEVAFSYFIYAIHGIFGILILIHLTYALFLAFRNKILLKEALFLIILATFTTFGGFLTKTELLSPVSSSIHMILTILTLALLSYMTAICYFDNKLNRN
jgi:heme a synthase